MSQELTSSAATVGVSAFLADISGLLAAFPAVSFVAMGMVGGLAGWALAMDRGELDVMPWRQMLCMLWRRLILGGCIGIAAGVWWADSPNAIGAWLMVTGLLSIDPVRGTQAVWERAMAMIPRAQK